MNADASSAVRMGVEPSRGLRFGPRTGSAGFSGRTFSNVEVTEETPDGREVLFDRGGGELIFQLLDVGGDNHRGDTIQREPLPPTPTAGSGPPLARTPCGCSHFGSPRGRTQGSVLELQAWPRRSEAEGWPRTCWGPGRRLCWNRQRRPGERRSRILRVCPEEMRWRSVRHTGVS